MNPNRKMIDAVGLSKAGTCAALMLALMAGVLACDGSSADSEESDDESVDDDLADDDTAADDDDDADDDSVDDDADDDSVDDDTGDDDTSFASEFVAVEIGADALPATKLAVQACVGLRNRALGGSVYGVFGEKDTKWLDELELAPSEVVDDTSFLDSCVAEFPCVRYAYAEQQRLLPNILTVGAALGAIPLDVDMPTTCETAAFDAIARFETLDTPELATRYVYENYVNETTGLAMINPGFDSSDTTFWDPELTGDIKPFLVDFVFSEKLFVIFLVNGCIGLSSESELLDEIAASNPWPKPIGVYGYADYWMVFGGYLFESQTLCAESRNMGAIPTSEANNLSFFSRRREPITEVGEIEQNDPEDIAYDPDTTYVAFVVGDGDNISYILDSRGEWLRQRLDDCEQAENSCEPITWSISPHLPRVAPDVLEWYVAKSRTTGKDYFMLPPSGHLYSYPASLRPDMQDAFVAATEHDARLLDADTTIDWEWWNTWERAEAEFFPKYAREGGDIRGIFPVNVPYMFPIFTWDDPEQFFKVIPGDDGGEVALFRTREWRGIDDSGSGLTQKFYLSPANMAAELADYPPGTVAYVYMTSDGGLNLENSFMALVQLLPDHVRLVSTGTAARLAVEASKARAIGKGGRT